MTTSTQTPAGWYADPSDAAQYRWFDGNAWTSHVQPAPAAAVPQAAVPAVAIPVVPSAQVPVQSSYGQAAYVQPTYSHSAYPQQQVAGGCQQCGAVPALTVKLHGHIGMVILQRFLTYRGRFCRDCGISQFRRVQKQLLLLGWWGFISFFVTIVNIGQNLFTFSRLRSLGAPQNRLANPASPGGSVFASPGFVVSVIIAVLVAAVVH
jgi:Protein of unknown function (DUF2510)